MKKFSMTTVRDDGERTAYYVAKHGSFFPQGSSSVRVLGMEEVSIPMKRRRAITGIFKSLETFRYYAASDDCLSEGEAYAFNTYAV